MADDSKDPVTKGDLQQLEDRIDAKLDMLKQEMFLHFDVAVENITSGLQGANRDEIELMKDTDRKHGQRITRLEQQVGMAA